MLAACLAWPYPASSRAVGPASTVSRPDYLGSVALPVARTPLDISWRQVPENGSINALASAGEILGSVRGKTSRQKVEAINAWTNKQVRFASDRALYGKPDYWASPAQTLQLRKGDCEDIAILKRGLLIAAGIPASSLYLTIARDLARREDHAILIVDSRDGPLLLDNATDDLLDARKAYDYRPVFTFGQHGKWLHGYARGEPSARTEALGQN